jgi:hypothetical protein
VSATPAPWTATSQERHLAAPREAAWRALLRELGTDPGDLSVEPPWRHVRSVDVGEGRLCQTTVAIRDDGDECHLAWCAGTSVEGDEAVALLDRLAAEGEALLDAVATRA